MIFRNDWGGAVGPHLQCGETTGLGIFRRSFEIQGGCRQGLINEKDFDARVASGQQKVEEVVEDQNNVMEVANQRIPVAIIDKNVLKHLMDNDKALAKFKDDVVFHPKVLINQKIFVAFKKSKGAEAIRNILNAGLKKVNIEEIKRSYFGGKSK